MKGIFSFSFCFFLFVLVSSGQKPSPSPTRPTHTPSLSPSPLPPSPSPSPTPLPFSPSSPSSPSPSPLPLPSPSPSLLSLSPSPSPLFPSSSPSPLPSPAPSVSPTPIDYVPEGDRSYVSSGGMFSLFWAFPEEREDDRDDVVLFTVRTQNPGWVGVGFSKNSEMGASDMVILSLEGGDDCIISDRHTPPDYYSLPIVDVTISSQFEGEFPCTYSIEEIQSNNKKNNYGNRGVGTINWVEYHFSKQISPANTSENIDLYDTNFILWAVGEGDVGEDGKGSFQKHYEKGIARVYFPPGKPKNEGWRYIIFLLHALFFVTAWLFIAPVSIIMARYMKATYGDYWLSFHKTAGAVIFFLNFVGVILGAIFVGVMEKDHFASLHSRLGFIAFGLLILQMMLGTLSEELWDASRTEPPLFPDKIHWYNGRLLFLFVIVLTIWSIIDYNLISIVGWVLVTLWLLGVCVFAGFSEVFWERAGDVGYEGGQQEGLSERIRASVRRAILLHRLFVSLCLFALIFLIVTWIFIIKT